MVKLEIFKFEYVEIELRLSLTPNTDKPDVLIFPTTFNELLHTVTPFNVFVPLIYYDEFPLIGLFITVFDVFINIIKLLSP